MKNIDKTGFISTLNNMGFMLEELDDFSLEFISHAIKKAGPSLDVGCAFGVATIPAILKGAKIVANDVHKEHLTILSSKIPEYLKKNLVLHEGSFPDNFVKIFGENSFENVLISRVLHFLTGKEIEKCFEVLSQIIKPGGRAFIINETPYLKNVENFRKIYENRLQTHVEWPGEIHNFKEIDNRAGVNLPNFMHLLDIPVLERVSRQFGFIIEKCSYIKREIFPKDIILDGKESVGLIIQNPF
jgi:SAM-dependent methyltransferase